jgi:DNA-binding MarR family transcriptional regulator
MRKADIARYIMGAIPWSPQGALPADQLALVLLLEACGPIPMIEIQKKLGLPSVTTVYTLVEHAEKAWRVRRSQGLLDAKVVYVELTERANRERTKSRDARSGPRRIRRGPVAQGPGRAIVEFGAEVGDFDVLECGHTLLISDSNMLGARKRRRCLACAHALIGE